MQYQCGRSVRGLILTAALLISGAVFGFGFSIQPITQEFRPAGEDASQLFQLHNPEDRPIAVEFSMLTRELQADGTEIREAADEQFTIFPARVILDPDERRAIRVRWQGNPAIEQEQAYRLLAEQLPVDFDESGDDVDGGVINIMFRYLAAVYITPADAEADIQAGIDRQEQGTVWVRLSNRGTSHRILKDLSLSLELVDGTTTDYPPESLEGLAQHNLLAGATRIYPLQLPDGTAAEAEDVSFQLGD